MDQAPQPEDVAANTEREERRADVHRRIGEVAGVLAETLLGMWRAKHRAERRGEPWPPPEPPKPEPRSSGLIEKPKGPPHRVFRELEARDELVAHMLLEMTWFPTSELWLEPAGGKRTRVVLEHGRVVIGVAVLDEYGDAAVLRALAVRATCRRQKHGRALVEYIVRHAYEVGVGACTPSARCSGSSRQSASIRASQAHDAARGHASPPGHHRRAQQRLRLRADADTQTGRRVPRRSVPRSAVEALLTRSELKAAH